jgi:hypothetical protein
MVPTAQPVTSPLELSRKDTGIRMAVPLMGQRLASYFVAMM